MEQEKGFVGGIPGQQVDSDQLQEALFKVMKQTAGSAAPALGTFTKLQQRRATRLNEAAKSLRKKLGKDHPDVLAVEGMAQSITELKGKISNQAARAKNWPKPRPNEWIVFGTVRDQEGKPAEGLIVRVFDRDRKYDDLLGETETDANGDFSVVYHERDFKETRENLPELYVMVSDAKGALLYSSRDSLRYKAGTSEYFAIRLAAQGGTAGRQPAKARSKKG